MTRKWMWAALGLIAAAILISTQIRNAPVAPGAGEASGPSLSESPRSGASLGTPADRPPQGGMAATGAAIPPQESADPEFQKWIAEEAKSLNYTNVDSERKQAQIKKVLKEITPSQSRQLLNTARDPQAPSGEKILSTYMMVEGGLNTRAELMDFVKDDTGPVGEPHSQEEIDGVRDKSLRIMAIDGLFAQAQKDPGARAALAREIPSIQDPYVKAYAQRKLEELDRSQQ